MIKTVREIFVLVSLAVICARCTPTETGTPPPSSAQDWQKIGPGGGGATFIPTFSYQTPENFLIRCDMTGTYLTKNGGATYQQFNFDNGAACFAYDPQHPAVIYAGSTALNKSSDGGKTWERIFPSKEEIRNEFFSGDHAESIIETSEHSLYTGTTGTVSAIRVDPVLPDALYFTMGSFFFYTFDAGKTWKREDLHRPLAYLYSNPSNLKGELCIFFAEGFFIFNKSTKTFTRREFPEAMAPAFSFTAGTVKNGDGVVMYALHHDTSQEVQEEFGYSEIWRSSDNGNTWKRVSDALITNAATGVKPSFSTLSCAEFDAGQAYVISNRYVEKNTNGTSSYWYGALKTNDSGTSWCWVWKGGGGSGKYGIKDGTEPANLTDAWVKKAFGGEYVRLIDAGVFPSDGNVAIVTDWYRTMKTMDGGKTWNEIYSNQNKDSTYTSRGMDVTTAYGVHTDPFNPRHLAISYTDIGYHASFDGGKSWSRSVNGVPWEWVNTCYWVAFDPAQKNKVWSVWSGAHDYPRGKMTRNPKWKESSSAKGGVCVSTDGGKTWKPTIDGMGTNSPATSIVIDTASAIGNRTLYATVYNKGVFKSVDDGKTWTLKNNGIEENTCAFEIAMGGNGTLWLTVTPVPAHKNGKKGMDFYSGAVYRSTNGAESWQKIHVSDGLLFPNHVEVDPANPNRIYLACWANIMLSDLVGGDVVRSSGGNKTLDMPGGIFLSEDAGATWVSIFDKHQYVYNVTVDTNHPGRLYCNTFNKAAYRSEDYGKTWKKIKGYDFHWGQRIVVDKADTDKVFITTYGSSVWHGVPATE